MDDHKKNIELARKYVGIADHILTQTYPLLKDSKLLLVVAENLFRSASATMSGVLAFERLYKKIPPYHNTFAGKMQIFEARNRRRYKFNPKYVDLLKTLRRIMHDHSKSPVEFPRKDKYIIADEDYNIALLEKGGLKEKLESAKLFIEDVDKWIGKHERRTP